MIERVIAWSVRNSFLTIAFSALFAALGIWASRTTPTDAIPDLSENQVIVFADWMGRSPQEVEAQVTSPLSTRLGGLAGVRAVRATSEFGFSMIHVIFEDGIDPSVARTEVAQRLATGDAALPEGVAPYLAPDATALGQIFWYTVEGDGRDLGELRAAQDFYVRPHLASVRGVAEVASVGGMPREWQVGLDPARLRGFGVTLGEIVTAIARSNAAVGGSVVQKASAEYVVRGIGWLRDLRDLEDAVVTTRDGVPLRVRDVASVALGGAARRGVLEKDGREAVGGVVLLRTGENPLAVTKALHERLREIAPGLPPGVRVVPFYERTRLIEDAIGTVTSTVLLEMLVSASVILLVMRHLGASLVVCIALPLATLGSFLGMRLLGLPSNIMALSGIAISIGVLEDQAVVLADNAMHHLRKRFGDAPARGELTEILVQPCQEVGRPIFFSILIMVISFLPVFALSGIEGRMFHPLAWTKTLALLSVGLLTITLLPALLPLVLKGRIRAEEDTWFVRSVAQVYRPVLSFLIVRPRGVVLAFAVILGVGWILAGRLGREFMPPLDEGSVLDMPVTVPRASVTQVRDDLLARNSLLRGFPEVSLVVGKAGRAETATDPSPLDMVETVVGLHPKELWPPRHLEAREAVTELRRVERLLVERGLLPETSDAEEDALLAGATPSARARFDATLRHFAHQRGREATPALGRTLVREGLLATAEFLGSEDRLLRAPSPAEIDTLVTELSPVHGGGLAEGPHLASAAALLRDAAEGLVRSGAARPGADLLVETRSGLEAALRGVQTSLFGEPPDVAARVRARLASARHAFLVTRLVALRRELEALAGPAFEVAAIEALVGAARAKGTLLREPDEATTAAIRTAREEAFHPALRAKTKEELVEELDRVVRVPGWANIWTQPIVNRIDMLATGIRTQVGVKVYGEDLAAIERLGAEVAEVLRGVPGAVDVFPDQASGEGYIEVEVDRDRAARYGVQAGDVLDVVEYAVGGRAVTQTVLGRERYPVRVRSTRDARADEESIRRTLVAASDPSSSAGAARGAAMPLAAASTSPQGGGMAGMEKGAPMPSMSAFASSSGAGPDAFEPRLQVELGEVADVRVVEGPSMIKSENGMLCGYVQMNVRDRDLVGFVEEAQRTVEARVKVPPGMSLDWSGQFEHQLRARRTLQVVFPVVIALIFLILYATYRDLAHAGLMMLAVPGALAGGVLFQSLFGFDFSVAVWVGYIACFGMATQTGIVMLVYLRQAIENAGGLARIGSEAELRALVLDGAVRRLRPKLLTEGTTILGLAPMLFATGTGAEVMRPMAAPVLGGILLADEVIDVFLPVLFYEVERRRWRRHHREAPGASALSAT